MGRSGNKLTKLKSVLKKLNSFGHQNKHQPISPTPSFTSSFSNSPDNNDSSSYSSTDLRPVYVGQSRRLYLVSSAVVHHPLFCELTARSSNGMPSPDGDNHSSSLTIACEVVLFEHLLWMLENAESWTESLDDLVEFYAY